MMGIKRENMYELVDASHANIEETFDKMCDKILAVAPKLRPLTGIGSNRKFTGGVPWKYMKKFAFKLIDIGVIKVNDIDGTKRVDLDKLYYIEVGQLLLT